MKKIGLIVLLSAIVGSVWAVPARRGGLVVTQPDGSELTVYQHGDEHFHWMTNEKGEWLKVRAVKDGRAVERWVHEQQVSASVGELIDCQAHIVKRWKKERREL